MKAVFNPFQYLSAEQLAALTGSFTKQWKESKDRVLYMTEAQSEFGASEAESLCYAWIKSEAESICDRNAVNEAVAAITSLLPAVARAKNDVPLDLIATEYETLKASLRKTVGVRVRDFAMGEYDSASAQKLMDKVYAKLEVSEKDWMRK